MSKHKHSHNPLFGQDHSDYVEINGHECREYKVRGADPVYVPKDDLSVIWAAMSPLDWVGFFVKIALVVIPILLLLFGRLLAACL